MRLTIYIILVVFALGVVSYWGQPIQDYLIHVKTEIKMQQRQTEIIKTDKRSVMLQKNLVQLNKTIPAAARERIALIHNAISNDGVEILQYDIISAVSPTSHMASLLNTNLPLSNWSDFLRPLIAHQCAVITVNSMINANERARLGKLKISIFVTCPILDQKGQLLGALFADYTKPEELPANLDSTETALKTTATNIAFTVGNFH